MFLVGVTGGIATGKSTVSKLFVDLKCPLIDADVVAREVVEPGKPAWKKIKRAFGDDVILENGTLNREKLGSIIFEDSAKRRLLNSITHPEIRKSMLWNIFMYLLKGHQYVLLDLPLLFESAAMINYLNTIIVVHCDEGVQIERLVERNSYTTEEARKRIDAQLPLADKCRRATILVDNGGTVEETRRQVLDIHDRLARSMAHWKLRTALLCTGGLLMFGLFCSMKTLGIL